ncbi:chemotaxis protein CheW [Lusitaniella coriacea LEGE 07157]|uniref:Chemotaxis protein CheW n=1 Tax=Lusitaniella coriacea LEGE 07157 TaxID=945747 RepID=A0A8J7DXM9_9CYAN|nr:chemotaxis protein CheW [Lusitaniella coriacea]MBE9117322.1 chemotaxis protein CheW [Lusitaniella coriacea LEGE 07157]
MVGNPDFSMGKTQDISSDIERLEMPEGELHLRFYLPSNSEFALSATGIKEVMNQPPDRITPIPNASPLLLGTINLRGQVIWVADLGQFLGDTVALNTQRQEIPIIAIEDQETMLGLAIEKIGEMQWLDIAQIQMQTNVPNHMAPFIRGEWILDRESNQSLRLLDQLAILRSARWAA